MKSTTHDDERGNQGESMREPPQLRETLKVLKMKDLPPKTTPWKDIEEKFLPVDFLLLTAKECEYLSCLSFLNDIEMGYGKTLGPVHFGFNSSQLKIAVIRCAMGASGPGGSLIVVQEAVPILMPKAVICVGYCASLDEEKAKLGDVIVSAKLITYALTKVSKDGIKELGFVVPPQQRMAKLIKVAGAGWVEPLKNAEDLKVTVRGDGVLLSGPTVLDSPELRSELKNRFKQGTAIEMEGEGIVQITPQFCLEP